MFRVFGQFAAVAALSACATTATEYSIKGGEASIAGKHVEAAEAYTKAAELARAEGSADQEAMALMDAGGARALLKHRPGNTELAVQQFRRARELFKSPGKTSISREDRTGWMAMASYEMANVLVDTDPAAAKLHIAAVTASCRGPMSSNELCSTATTLTSRLAGKLNNPRQEFELEFSSLKSPIRSRIPSAYDLLASKARALNLVAQAAEIEKAKAALLSVEGPNPDAAKYTAAEAPQIRLIAAELQRQAQLYSTHGVYWLAQTRQTEANLAVKDAEQQAENARQVAAIKADRDQNLAQSRAAQQRSLEQLKEAVALRSGGATPVGTAATSTPIPTPERQAAAGTSRSPASDEPGNPNETRRFELEARGATKVHKMTCSASTCDEPGWPAERLRLNQGSMESTCLNNRMPSMCEADRAYEQLIRQCESLCRSRYICRQKNLNTGRCTSAFFR